MSIKWRGRAVISKMRRAQITGVNTTMLAAILKAKADHSPGARSGGRFETQTGSLERSIRITEKARRILSGVQGIWGSVDTGYARRIELGFQGKDSKGRVVDAPAYPFLIPAAQEEYPMLAKRIRGAWLAL